MAPELSGILIVESGVHQGARAALARGRSLVGSSADKDIIISDFRDGTAFTLDHRGRDIMLHADAAVEFPGRKPLAPRQSRRCVSSVRFTSGGVTLRLEIAAASSATRADSGLRGIGWRLPAIVAAALAAISLVPLISFSTASSTTRSDDALMATASIPTASGRVLPSSQSRQQFALDQLRQHLAAIDLGSLILTAQPDGAIEARGQISKAQQAAWREVGHWFDSIAAGQAVLVDAVTVTADAQPLAIQAVWSGDNPYVIDGGGEKLFVGSALPSGWTVSGIDRSRVLIKRGDETVAVRF